MIGSFFCVGVDGGTEGGQCGGECCQYRPMIGLYGDGGMGAGGGVGIRLGSPCGGPYSSDVAVIAISGLVPG